MAQRLRVHIQGIVQGVGFRPFIYQLAHRHQLNGYVANTPRGVEIEVEGGQEALQHFLEELPQTTPPLASITQIDTEELPAADYNNFEIKSSEKGEGREPSYLLTQQPAAIASRNSLTSKTGDTSIPLSIAPIVGHGTP